MDAFVIRGGKRLRGRVRVNGSKNASLPLMAAALLTDEPLTLRDVPQLSDISNMMKLLGALGCKAESFPGSVPAGGNGNYPGGCGGYHEGRSVKLHAADPEPCLAHYDIVRTMRASICVLGPLLAKRGQARVSMPGGCNIGDRPVDLHLRGLRALGATIRLDEGYITAEAPGGPGGRLKGARVFLGGPFGSTVLGTANILSAATLAEGTTVIESAACEPEIADLAELLNQMGARISGAGSPRIVVEGVDRLRGTAYTVMPDRIEAGTYLMAAAITNGDVTLENFPTDTLIAALDRLEEVGVSVEALDEPEPVVSIAMGAGAIPPPAVVNGLRLRETVRVTSHRRLEPVQVVTQTHPGFPTDLQAQITALLCLADGNSIVTEKIFPDRFMHVAELLRMGAHIMRTGTSAMITGVKRLEGAPVMASDLRASAGLIIAGLAAHGVTTVNRVYHLDRGYERMEITLQALGADIERIDASGA